MCIRDRYMGMVKVRSNNKTVDLVLPLTYEECVLHVKGHFKELRLKKLIFQYCDDGDLITVSSDFDYNQARDILILPGKELLVKIEKESQDLEGSFERLSQNSDDPIELESITSDTKQDVQEIVLACDQTQELSFQSALSMYPPDGDKTNDLQLSEIAQEANMSMFKSYDKETMIDLDPYVPKDAKLHSKLISSSCDQVTLSSGENTTVNVVFENNGQYHWPRSCQIQCVEGYCRGYSVSIDKCVAPGEKFQATLSIQAPERQGEKMIGFRAFNPLNGEAFGQKFRLIVAQKKEESPLKPESGSIKFKTIPKGGFSSNIVNIDFIEPRPQFIIKRMSRLTGGLNKKR
eukprot:TRINITY_DN8679_c0_g1_i2.p1 TRINITY_DN8679_c0_g1~~TRINITY_DN8679_c0_g1_i2.p1  ORF type:complete len:347 (-),score=60.87 TRINITY_DN8679_c0_g1_i2:126-1166(-)